MKKYRIREKSIAWYVIKLRYIICICSLLILAILLGQCLVSFAVEPNNYTAHAHYKGSNIFMTEDGNEWEYISKIHCKIGTEVKLTFHNNETKQIVDDSIIKIDYGYQYYDVPLNKDLQTHIINLCKDYGVEPKIIIAMIERESNYKPNAIGDSGDSLGLMQVQPKWHKKRMNKLGVTDLLDPYQNVKVGIDIFAEKANKYSTTEEALTVYNAGDNGAYNLYFSKGIKANQYALDIIKIANNLTLLKS